MAATFSVQWLPKLQNHSKHLFCCYNMTSVVQSLAVRGLTCMLTTTGFVCDRLNLTKILNINISNANITPLSLNPHRYYLRASNKDCRRLINVFDDQGALVYTIERISSLVPTWSLLTVPDRKEIMTINTSIFSKCFQHHNGDDRQLRNITNSFGFSGIGQVFYLNDGFKYFWTSGSKVLERTVNDNSSEEQRFRVARVKLMKQFSFDYEILVDEFQVKREVAFASAFVSALTQWGTGTRTNMTGPTPLTLEITSSPSSPQKLVLVVEDSDETEYVIKQEQNT